MRTSLLVALAFAACGPARADLDAGSVVDAGAVDAGAADAGSPDAGGAWALRVQPLLWAHCADCHARDGGEVGRVGPQVPFVEAHATMLGASTLCPGETVGRCVGRALEAQVPEGTRCRTVVVVPFHREGWPCLTGDEVREVVDWVDAGLPER